MKTVQTFYGYKIQNGKKYLKSIYNGVASWTTDYTYAKTYKTEKKALEVIKSL